MDNPRLLVLSRQGRASLPASVWSRLRAVARVRIEQRPSAPDLPEAAGLFADADLVAATNLCLPPVTGELLDAAPHLRGIVLYATGYDHLDVRLLTARRVGLSVVTDYATTAVAEHTMALVLALATRLHLANDRCRGWAPREVSLRGIELSGRTLGVVGMGRIGARVAAMARSFGLRVIATDTDGAACARAHRAGIAVHRLPDLLASSDVVTLCASHRFGAPPILGARDVSRMPPGALLVNAARSALVDTPAVVAALRSGHLRGYAVDDELVGARRYADLTAEGRLVQTGHIAWWRDEAMRRGARMWGERMIAAATGTPLDAVFWPTPWYASGAAVTVG